MSSPITVKVNRRYQVTLPRVACERLNIQPGDRLLVEVQAGVLRLIPQPAEKHKQEIDARREVREGAASYETPETSSRTHAVTLALHEDQWRYVEEYAATIGASVEQVLAQALEEWIAWRRTLEEDPIQDLFGAAKTDEKMTSEHVDDIVYTLP